MTSQVLLQSSKDRKWLIIHILLTMFCWTDPPIHYTFQQVIVNHGYYKALQVFNRYKNLWLTNQIAVFLLLVTYYFLQ